MLTSLPYYGGKSPIASNRLCQWILSLLPVAEYETTYCEPFAGMLSVLLNRPRVSCEMANDSSKYIYNLWRCIRDYPHELKHRMSHTLISEHDYQRAVNELDQSCGVEQAMNTAILIISSMPHTPHCTKGNFRIRYESDNRRSIFDHFSEVLPALGERVRAVQFLNRDALTILDRMKDVENCVIYCDPPYMDAKVEAYGKNTLNHDDFKELLLVQKGKVSVSGYGNFYDDLLEKGWTRHEKSTKSYQRVSDGTRTERIEVLWNSFDQRSHLPELFEK